MFNKNGSFTNGQSSCGTCSFLASTSLIGIPYPVRSSMFTSSCVSCSTSHKALLDLLYLTRILLFAHAKSFPLSLHLRHYQEDAFSLNVVPPWIRFIEFLSKPFHISSLSDFSVASSLFASCSCGRARLWHVQLTFQHQLSACGVTFPEHSSLVACFCAHTCASMV